MTDNENEAQKNDTYSEPKKKYLSPRVINTIIFICACVVYFVHIYLDELLRKELLRKELLAEANPQNSNNLQVPTDTISDIDKLFIEGGSGFLNELAFALLIACILNVSIEYFNRRRHEELTDSMLAKIDKKYSIKTNDTIDQISLHLFEVIYKRNIPETVFEEVKAGLFTTEFFRKDWKTTYTFHIKKTEAPNWSGNKQYVLQEVLQSYKVENINSLSSKIFEIPVLFNIVPDDDLKKLCRITSAYIGGVPVSDEELSKQKIDKSGQFMTWSTPTPLIKIKESIDIKVLYTQVQHIYGNEVLCSFLPCASMELEIDTPDEGLCVEVISLHPKDAEPIQPLNNKLKRTWSLPFGIFPGQGLYCQWQPRNKVAVDDSNVICNDKTS